MFVSYDFACEGLYLERNWFIAWFTYGHYLPNYSENMCSKISVFVVSTNPLLTQDLLKCFRQAQAMVRIYVLPQI